jgi:hypothetical protein
VPVAWEKLEALKQRNPSICQKMTGSNEEVFRKIKENEAASVVFLEVFEGEKPAASSPLAKEINAYLDTVRSYKEEMNHFLGKNKKVTLPEVFWEALDEYSHWPARATLYDGSEQLVT